MPGARAAGKAPGAPTAALEVAALQRELAKERIRPAYLILGEELLLRREASQAIEAAALGDDPTARALGRQVFSGGEARIGDILAATAGLPMFGGRRLVLVDGIERLRKGDREALLPALTNLPDSTILVLTADKLDGRLTFTRDLRRRTAVVSAAPLPERELPEWIGRRFAARGHRISRACAERLLLLTGPGLSALAGEIEKVSLYVGEAGQITEEDLNRVVAGGLGGTLDDLTRAVGERDLARALAALAGALEAGEEPLRILGFVAYRLGDLWRLANGIRGWVRPEVEKAARNYTTSELARAISLLHEADLALKGVGGRVVPLAKRRGDRLILEKLLFAVLEVRSPPHRRPLPARVSRVAGANRQATGNTLE